MPTIAEQLRDAPPDRDDYVEFLSSLLDDAASVTADTETFVEAFRFMERNATADLGSPGPLVHFLERHYPRYVGELVESVRRHATTHALWMVNRALNGTPDQDARSRLQAALSHAAVAASDPIAREQAREFLHLYERTG